MFAGNYAVGFLLKKKFTHVPLWLIFLAVQLADILAFLLVLLGIEKIAYISHDNPFLRTVLEYVPFSHSLFTNIVLAIIVFLVFYEIKNLVWGMALSIGVISSWFLNVLVHQPDLPVFFDNLKLGLGLWAYPTLAFSLELVFFLVAGFILFRKSKNIIRGIVLMFGLAAGYFTIVFAPEAEANPIQNAFMALAMYAVFTGLALWTDWRPKRTGLGSGGAKRR